MPYVKKVYIYRESNQPEEGWFQSCFNCYTLTSNIIDYTTIVYEHYHYECDIYICRTCERMFHKPCNLSKQLRFRKKCDAYIDELFPC